MVKKESRSLKKKFKKPVKKSIKTSVKKMVKSNKKRTKYLLQAELMQKVKKKSVEFTEKPPVIESAIMKTEAAVKKVAESAKDFVRDTKTVGGYVAESVKERFKSEPKKEVEEEIIPKKDELLAKQTPAVKTYEAKLKQGLFGRAVEFDKSTFGKKFEVKENRVSGESFETQVEQAIRENFPEFKDANINIHLDIQKSLLRVEVKPKEIA